MFFFKKKPKTERNPWLDIPHDCNWLPANDGKELVCGDCSRRRSVVKSGNKPISK